MQKLLQAPIIIQGISTLKDKSLKFTCYTREINPEEKAMLFEYEGKEGWFVFKENHIQESEVPKEPAKADKEVKTQSQRLRNTLWVLWSKIYPTANKSEFEKFKENRVELFIDSLKKEIKQYE